MNYKGNAPYFLSYKPGVPRWRCYFLAQWCNIDHVFSRLLIWISIGG